MNKKTKRELSEQKRFNMNMQHLSAYLQIACDDGIDPESLKKVMDCPEVITRIPLSNERFKELAAKIYVYYQVLKGDIGISLEVRNGIQIVQVKKIEAPF